MAHVDAYKDAKEQWVSGLSGSTVAHINMISSAALASIVLYSALRSRFSSWVFVRIPTAWVVLVLPLLLSMTVFADIPGLLTLAIFIPSLLVVFLSPAQEYGTPLPSNSPSSPMTPRQPSIPKPTIAPLPSLTVYRSHMLLMTILAILAVDFPVFPRSLAKCETYGVSLMDMGVGSFVFSQGIVSAIPILKDPRYLHAPVLPKLLNVTRKCLPVILLGLVRVLLVKGTDYPEHESEYGAHWNFFITLALVPVMQVLVHPLLAHFSVAFLGVSIALAQQVALSYMGLERYVLYAPRVNLVSANKEGIVSLTGYFAIHLLGLSLGTIILPPNPSYFRRIQKKKLEEVMHGLREPRRMDKTATELAAYALVWWIAFAGVRYFQVDGGKGPSRSMVNLSYIIWVAAYNTSFILGYMLVDMFFAPPSPSMNKKGHKPPASPAEEFTLPPPDLLEAINKNGLTLFLVANVATGVVNLTLRTMYTSDLWAMLILSVYSFGVCALAWRWRRGKVLPL